MEVPSAIKSKIEQIDNQETGGADHGISWHTAFSSPPQTQTSLRDSCTDSNLATSKAHCISKTKQHEATVGTILNFDETKNALVIDSAQENNLDRNDKSESNTESKYGIKSAYEKETHRTYLHASIARKEGFGELFSEAPLFNQPAAKTMAEPEIWTMGAITAGHERKFLDDGAMELWMGLGVTVHEVFDRELREHTGEHPATVFTNIKIKF